MGLAVPEVEIVEWRFDEDRSLCCPTKRNNGNRLYYSPPAILFSTPLTHAACLFSSYYGQESLIAFSCSHQLSHLSNSTATYLHCQPITLLAVFLYVTLPVPLLLSRCHVVRPPPTPHHTVFRDSPSSSFIMFSRFIGRRHHCLNPGGIYTVYLAAARDRPLNSLSDEDRN